MVSSIDTLVKKLLTSNEIFLNLFGILSVFNLVIKSVVFDMVCLEFPSGTNNSTKMSSCLLRSSSYIKMDWSSGNFIYSFFFFEFVNFHCSIK